MNDVKSIKPNYRKHFQLISKTTIFIAKMEDNVHEDDVHVQRVVERD